MTAFFFVREPNQYRISHNGEGPAIKGQMPFSPLVLISLPVTSVSHYHRRSRHKAPLSLPSASKQTLIEIRALAECTF